MHPKNTTASNRSSDGPARSSASTAGSPTGSTPPSGRSQLDLLRWGAELLIRHGFRAEHGVHVVVWLHSKSCQLYPNRVVRASSRCRCRPDATIVLHVGTPQQRQVDIVREGIPLPGCALRGEAAP